MVLFNELLLIASALWAVPCLVFAGQIFSALRSSCQTDGVVSGNRPSVTVLMPAHNEQAVIGETLTSILPQLALGDRLLVVADNCDDRTADLALAAGAEVIERQDGERRGKGYALDYGLRHLAATRPPQVVVVIDADCRPAEGCIDSIVRQAERENRPVQAMYLMQAPDGNSLSQAVAEFAWRVKNQVRPLGLKRWNLPCQLMGSGMAFPWQLISQADLANDNMVEDMKLGIDLAGLGYPPSFCPNAQILSDFPSSAQTTVKQRTRWEHGHLATLLAEAPGLLRLGFKRRDLAVIAMALDLAVPPLTVLALVLSLLLGFGIVGAWFAGPSLAFWLPLILCGTFAAAVITAWLRFGRDLLSWRGLCAVPWYMLRKIPLYAGFLFNRQQGWVKTERH